MNKYKPKKEKYRVENWTEYNKALVKRGDITLYMPENLEETWYEKPSGKVGSSRKYSDFAIEFMLIIRSAYGRPLRQTQGFVQGLFQLMRIDLDVPDYSTVSRRMKYIKVTLSGHVARTKHMTLLCDSTGLTVFGDWSWRRKKYRNRDYIHRTWRKLHLAISSETQEIVGAELSDHHSHDSTVAVRVVQDMQEGVSCIIGDGGYDSWDLYREAERLRAKMIAPTRSDAAIQDRPYRGVDPGPRNETIRSIQAIGRKKWKEASGYHIRSLVEVAMYRYKKIFSESLQSTSYFNQQVEALVRCKVLNIQTGCGMPRTRSFQS